MSAPLITLNDGNKIPALGLGTWQSKPDEVTNAVAHALKNGYRHIDCAWMYQNEESVGEGIRQSGVPRSEIFITSKVWSTYHQRVQESLDSTLKSLGVDYVDLYLIHWPVPLNPNGNHPYFPTLSDGTRDILSDWKVKDTWKQMEDLLKTGKIKSIGVSNFSQKKLEEELLPYATVVPAVDQLELHLYNPDHKLVEFLKSKGIVPEAYSPLGSTGSPLFDDEVAVGIASRHSVKPADVLLAWLYKKGCVALPKSVTPSRIDDNLKGFVDALGKLDDSDVKKLDDVAASGKQKRFIMPPWGPRAQLGFDNWTRTD